MIKSIVTPADYEAALNRIASLMDAKSNTDIDELDLLATQVDAYEEVHFPIKEKAGDESPA